MWSARRLVHRSARVSARLLVRLSVHHLAQQMAQWTVLQMVHRSARLSARLSARVSVSRLVFLLDCWLERL